MIPTRGSLLIGLTWLVATLAILVMAHRPSTHPLADPVLVIDDGRIIERGDHQFLLRLCCLYHRQYVSQYQRTEP